MSRSWLIFPLKVPREGIYPLRVVHSKIASLLYLFVRYLNGISYTVQCLAKWYWNKTYKFPENGICIAALRLTVWVSIVMIEEPIKMDSYVNINICLPPRDDLVGLSRCASCRGILCMVAIVGLPATWMIMGAGWPLWVSWMEILCYLCIKWSATHQSNWRHAWIRIAHISINILIYIPDVQFLK